MKKGIPIILMLLIWAGSYYLLLPPMNIKSQEMWSFFAEMLIVGVVLNAFELINELFIKKNPFQRKENMKKMVKWSVLPVGVIAFYVIGTLLSSPILRASDYYQLLSLETGDFATDITEVNYTQIPILDSDSASRLAEREMGSLVDMVSQYEVSAYFTQINLDEKPVRVTPLRYGDPIKWFMNRDTGIPGYMKIDMTTQNVELVRLEEGIKYSPSEYFSRDLYRHIRFAYPTAMIHSMNFEVNEKGEPYWVCAVEDKTIGLFGGTDIIGIILVNAQTGEHVYYDVADVPSWVDQVYNASLLIEQYNYHGVLKNGFINSIFGQREVLQSTEGYNYIALDGDVWVYTGVTSIGSDQSNVGFVLMNTRTKESKYYQIAGAKEISAMSSAEGQVQHLGYMATFPILLNIANEPTYFLSLKDGAGLVKKYAMVNIEKYQIVATGDTVLECEKNYRELMAGNGIELVSSVEMKSIKGTISDIQNIVIDGNTIYYIALEESKDLFAVLVKENLEILKLKIGDVVSFEYQENENQMHTVHQMK